MKETTTQPVSISTITLITIVHNRHTDTTNPHNRHEQVDPTMGLRMGDVEAHGLPWQPPCREEDEDVAAWWAGFLLGAGGGEAKE